MLNLGPMSRKSISRDCLKINCSLIRAALDASMCIVQTDSSQLIPLPPAKSSSIKGFSKNAKQGKRWLCQEPFALLPFFSSGNFPPFNHWSAQPPCEGSRERDKWSMYKVQAQEAQRQEIHEAMGHSRPKPRPLYKSKGIISSTSSIAYLTGSFHEYFPM